MAYGLSIMAFAKLLDNNSIIACQFLYSSLIVGLGVIICSLKFFEDAAWGRDFFLKSFFPE